MRSSTTTSTKASSINTSAPLWPAQAGPFRRELGAQSLGTVEDVAHAGHVVLAAEQRTETAQLGRGADPQRRVGLRDALRRHEAAGDAAEIRFRARLRFLLVDRHAVRDRVFPIADGVLE